MENPTTYTELERRIKQVLPQASIETDNNGQLVVYTNLGIDYAQVATSPVGSDVMLKEFTPEDECQRCGSVLDEGYCVDETCPYYDYLQTEVFTEV